jgi:thiol-disulfide isomerase/thioredoxin
MKFKKSIGLALATVITLCLAGCGTGGTSTTGSNAYISGNGSGFIIPEADRKLAPAITGKDLNGAEINIVAGKVTVINVWASWCSPCRAEAPLLADFAQKNPQIQFIGILTRDNDSAAISFVNHFKIGYPTLADDSIIAKFHGNFPPNAIPTSLVIDAHGKVAARISGEVTTSLLKDILQKISGSNVNA